MNCSGEVLSLVHVVPAILAIPSLDEIQVESNSFRKTSYTNLEQVLKDVRSKPNWEDSVLFSRRMLQAIHCSSLKFKMFFLL
jgi:hypothetical protein